jgi:hypothetical protein
MTSPFRDRGIVQEFRCPRCKKHKLPAVDVAACPGGCGTLVSAFAATEIFDASELRVDAATRWWRPREKCVMCDDKMKLRGKEPGLFQGCDGHAFWVDRDAIAQTGLAKGVNEEKLEAKRNNTQLIEREHEARQKAEMAREEAKRAKEEAEGRLASGIVLDDKRGDAAAATSAKPLPTVFSTFESVSMISSLGPYNYSILSDKLEMIVGRNYFLEERVSALERELKGISALLSVGRSTSEERTTKE